MTFAQDILGVDSVPKAFQMRVINNGIILRRQKKQIEIKSAIANRCNFLGSRIA
jgi:hypothetical protein